MYVYMTFEQIAEKFGTILEKGQIWGEGVEEDGGHDLALVQTPNGKYRLIGVAVALESCCEETHGLSRNEQWDEFLQSKADECPEMTGQEMRRWLEEAIADDHPTLATAAGRALAARMAQAIDG